MEYELVIGMEVHCELKTHSKMFCACPNGLGMETVPNTNVCPVCMGHPGALPTANREAINMVVKVGLALNADIPKESKFDRKNYFYPDLPKGYQISQYDQPITQNGTLNVDGRAIRITRVHLEEDTGKLQHPTGANYSLVDYNRSSVPLMELVTEPDVTSAKEAKRFCQELQLLLRSIGVSDADMEKGLMRCEANISLLPAGKERIVENFGTKVEVKNLNSFKAVERAIEYEHKRQAAVLESGGTLVQETRGWDENKNETFSQRKKESAHDYRYFPEPDIPPLWLGHIDEAPAGTMVIDVDVIRQTLPELPQAKRQRFIDTLGIASSDAYILTTNTDLAAYTEDVWGKLIEKIEALDGVEGSREEIIEREKKKLGKLLSGWITSELFKLINEENKHITDCKISTDQFAAFLSFIFQRRVNSSAAQVLLKEMYATGEDPEVIIEEKDLTQVDDEAALADIVAKIIADNPEPIADFKAGKENALQYLVGQAMKATKGKGNPATLQLLFREKITGE